MAKLVNYYQGLRNIYYFYRQFIHTMNSNLQTAFLYFLVGMVTVFIVLCIVVLTGRILIYFINKFGPASSKATIDKTDFKPLFTNKLGDKSTLNKKKIAAIVSTVEIITAGKGKIINIEKITSEN